MLVNFILAILFPQALSMSLECSKGWNNILASRDSFNPVSEDYQKMASFSGFELNKLGDFESCNKISIASYTLLVHSVFPRVIQSFCGPIECTEEDYYNSSLPIVYQRPLQVEFPYKYQKEHYAEYTKGAIVVIIVLLLIIGTAAIGTIAECFCAADENKNPLIKIVLCFSLIRNFKLLLSVRPKEKDNTLDVLNAVKVISFAWVMLGHALHNKALLYINSNYDSIISESSVLKFVLPHSSTYAVDSFFWVSAFLLSFLFVSGFISSFTQVFLFRLLRLLPAYTISLLFFTYLSQYLGSGPLFYKLTEINPLIACEDYLYTNILFLNNFIPGFTGNPCFVHGWYLAVDMQLFIVSTLILLVYLKISKSLGWILITSMGAVSIITSGILAHHYEFKTNFQLLFTANYFMLHYIKPYTRAKQYVLGLVAGLVLYSYRQLKVHHKVYDSFANSIAETINKNSKLVFASGVILFNILIFWESLNRKFGGNEFAIEHFSDTVNYAYIALSGFVYSFAITCILLPLLMGHFRLIIAFMSHSIWSFFAKISFSMYLLHLGIIYIEGRSSKVVEVFEIWQLLKFLIYTFMLCAISAIPLVLFVEFPGQNVVNLMMKKQTGGSSRESISQSKKLD
jgi:peptidoglycan/LPS O-acetylase OafA/YrhL